MINLTTATKCFAETKRFFSRLESGDVVLATNDDLNYSEGHLMFEFLRVKDIEEWATDRNVFRIEYSGAYRIKPLRDKRYIDRATVEVFSKSEKMKGILTKSVSLLTPYNLKVERRNKVLDMFFDSHDLHSGANLPRILAGLLRDPESVAA